MKSLPTFLLFLATVTVAAPARGAERVFYYVSGSADHGIWRATENEDGTWNRGDKVLIDGVFDGNAVDPDVVRLSDGSYRLFFFRGMFVSPPPADTGFFSATSSDGIHFTNVVKVFSLANATDPTAVRLLDGSYLMAVAQHTSPPRIVFAASGTGTHFSTNGAVITNGGIPELTLLGDGSVRVYYNGPGGIVSQRSFDGGQTWSAESGVRCSSSGFIADPSVVRNPDGSWLMFVKSFNGSGVPGPSGHQVQMARSTDGVSFNLAPDVLLDQASVPDGVIAGEKAAARLQALQHTGDAFLLELMADAGDVFVLEKSTNLLHWTALATNQLQSSAFLYTNFVAAEALRFFRALLR